MSDVEQEIQTISIQREIAIAAPIEIAFEAMLEEMGPGGEMPDGKPFPMVIEPWPGGRWYRDLGNNPATSGGTSRSSSRRRCSSCAGRCSCPSPPSTTCSTGFTADGEGTRLEFTHRAMGPIPERGPGGRGTGMGLRPQADRRDRGAAGGRAAKGGELMKAIDLIRWAMQDRRGGPRLVPRGDPAGLRERDVHDGSHAPGDRSHEMLPCRTARRRRRALRPGAAVLRMACENEDQEEERELRARVRSKD